MCEDSEVIQTVFKEIREKCQELDFKNKEIPTQIKLVKEEWTQDNNLLTAAFKMRRIQVNEFYSKEIAEMFAKIEADKQKIKNNQLSSRGL